MGGNLEPAHERKLDPRDHKMTKCHNFLLEGSI